ncbi:MAG: hypothetical protein ACO3A4_07685 [Silvanigrellaceae bacterium]
MQSNLPHGPDSVQTSSLSDKQKHDLKSALLSIKWAAELLRPADGSEPPVELIAEQLLHAFNHLNPVIEKILTSESKDLK